MAPLHQPRIEHEGTGRLGVPAPPDIGQAIQQPLALVAGQINVGQVSQLPLSGGHNRIQWTEDGNGKTRIGQAILPAPADIDSLTGALCVPLLQLAHEGWQARAGGVGAVDITTKTALQSGAAVALQTGLGPMTFDTEGLQLLTLPRERLGDGDDVIDLAGSQGDRGSTELAHSPLLC